VRVVIGIEFPIRFWRTKRKATADLRCVPDCDAADCARQGTLSIKTTPRISRGKTCITPQEKPLSGDVIQVTIGAYVMHK